MTNGDDYVSKVNFGSTLENKPLSKREYFASLAMQGLCANADVGSSPENRIAKYAVEQADALIAALNKED